jgi:hypothetical protein
MERLDPLLATPAAVRFISAEPLLGDLDLALRNWAHIGKRRDDCRIDWVIVGGESGHGARPMHPDWVRLIRQDCELAGVPFFFKQWGEWKPISEMQESEWEPYYVSRRKAKPYERQCDIDDLCGRRCTIPTETIRFDGEHGNGLSFIATRDGHLAYQSFRVGKKAAGACLSGGLARRSRSAASSCASTPRNGGGSNGPPSK